MGVVIIALGSADVNINKCMRCNSMERDVLSLPCCHVTVCSLCSPTVNTCFMCQESIANKLKVATSSI